MSQYPFLCIIIWHSYLLLTNFLLYYFKDPRASNTNSNKRGSSSENKLYSIIFASVEIQFRVGTDDSVVVENVSAANLETAEIVDGIPVLGSS